MATIVALRRGERLAWPDATRAVGVVAVVLFHVLIWNHAEVTDGVSPLGSIWDKTDAALSRVRMPILFALSGLLASRSLLGGSFALVRDRVVSNYYLYAVWLVIYALVFLGLGRTHFPHAISGWQDLVTQFAVPDTTLWFIFALAVYPLIILAFRTVRVPSWLALLLATGAWLLPTMVDMPGFIPKIIQCFVFFACGVYLSNWIRLAAAATWSTVLVLWAVFGATTVLGLGASGFLGEVATFLGGLTAIPASIAGIAKICLWEPVARTASFVGQRTLSIYVLHPLLLALLALVLNNESRLASSMTSSVFGDAMYPVALTVLIIAVALLIDVLLRKVPGNVFLQLPGTVRRPKGSLR